MIHRFEKKSYGRIKENHVIESAFIVCYWPVSINSMERFLQRPLTFGQIVQLNSPMSNNFASI